MKEKKDRNRVDNSLIADRDSRASGSTVSQAVTRLSFFSVALRATFHFFKK